MDWNQSDAQLDARMKAIALDITGAWGELFGRIVGEAKVLGVTYFIPYIGPFVMAATAIDRLPELGDELKSALTRTFMGGVQIAGIATYKYTRAFFKSLEKYIPFNDARKMLDSWGSGGEPWIAYNKITEEISSIENDFLERFLEDSYEGYLDGSTEAAIAVGMRVEDYINTYAESNRAQKGPERKVEIVIGPEGERSSAIVLAGNQGELTQTIANSVAQAQYFWPKEIIESKYRVEFSRGRTSEDRERSLKIIFRNQQEPPWRRPGQEFREWDYSIPNPKLGLSFAEIKLACGGSSHYNFGKWRANANLPSGKISIYADSKLNCERRRDGLLSLSLDADKATSLTATEVNYNAHGVPYNPNPEPIYAYMAILRVRRFRITGKKIDLERGARYDDEYYEMELWPDTSLPHQPSIFP
ncbi:hypothetical protein [Laspinema palackyanum]|uniref:hypothetical protein n=1 Tax=Laspinema palackyanum TaxID=3231601 RepID=UPI00349F33E0